MPGIFVMLNNYLHDLATAMFLCGVLLLWVLAGEIEHEGNKPGAKQLFVKIFTKFSPIITVSLVAIFAGGVIRAFNYRKYEWMEAAGRGQVTALVIKHIFLFIIVGTGVYLFVILRRKVKRFRSAIKE